MRAIQFDEYGSYDVLKTVDVPQPQPADGEVLVKLAAAAVNPFDNTVRMGYVAQVRPPMIGGNEGAGVVVGEGTDALPAGTRVMLIGAYQLRPPGTWRGLRNRRTDRRHQGARQPDRRRGGRGPGRIRRREIALQTATDPDRDDAAHPGRRRSGRRNAAIQLPASREPLGHHVRGHAREGRIRAELGYTTSSTWRRKRSAKARCA